MRRGRRWHGPFAAVNGSKLELDGAFENLVDALQASEVKDKAGQAAWVLIYRALARLIEFADTHGMPLERLGLPSAQEMMRYCRNAEEEALLAMHGICAAQTRNVIEIKWPAPPA